MMAMVCGSTCVHWLPLYEFACDNADLLTIQTQVVAHHVLASDNMQTHIGCMTDG